MNLDLEGKTALISGSSRGIGLAIAQALADEGCRGALNGRESSALQAASSSLAGSVSCVGDLSDPQAASEVVASAAAQLGSLDILVCNVGSGRSVPPGKETPDAWQQAFAANLWSTTNCVEAARAPLAKSRGVILGIPSICGRFAGRHETALLQSPVNFSLGRKEE